MTKSLSKYIFFFAFASVFAAFPVQAADETKNAQAQAEEVAEKATQSGDAVKTEDTREGKPEEKKPVAKEEKASEKTAEKIEEKKDEPSAEEQEVAKDPIVAKNKAAYEKAVAKADAALKDVGKDLKEEDAKHFFMTYQNYNLIGTVRMVQTDVGNAIKACGEHNPDMKEELDARYKSWNDAVNPVVEEADANIKNMVVVQEYAPAAKIKKVFKALDEARLATNASVEKAPVTTEDACESLLEKMDDTQENLIRLVRTTLISYGRVYPEMPEEKPAEKEKL